MLNSNPDFLMSAFILTLLYSLDYLGTVTASLRKDLQQTVSDDVRLDIVVKTLLYEELEEEEQTGDIDTIDISHVSFFSLTVTSHVLSDLFGSLPSPKD